MRWLKRGPLNSIAIGILLFLVLITWILIKVDKSQPAHAFTGGTVQGTPTVNTTAIVQDQLKQQDDKLQKDNSLPWILLNAVGSSIGTILVAAAALIAAWLGWRQWLTNRKDEQKKREEEHEQRREDQLSEQKKRAEERFQKVVEGFGGDNEGAMVGAAILLRTFLRPGYEQFYAQTFDLAVANLRLPRTPHASEDPDGVPYQPKDQESPLPLTTLSQALIVAFKEAFPLARNTVIGEREGALQSLDATNIKLDNAYLAEADLKQAWMPEASMRKANLFGANLSGANLSGANLSGANLFGADFRGVDLSGADLSGADLRGADLRGADLFGANLNGADLNGADLSRADLFGANLFGANLFGANLFGANLNGADLRRADLRGADLEDARSLNGTKLYGVKGLDEKQLAECESKGAISNKDSKARSSQSTVSLSPLSPGNDVQTPLAPSVQGDLSSPDADSSATSSKPDTEP